MVLHSWKVKIKCKKRALLSILMGESQLKHILSDVPHNITFLVGWQATWNLDFNNAVNKMDFFFTIFSLGRKRFKKAMLY